MKQFMITQESEKLKLISEIEAKEKKVIEYQSVDQMVLTKKVKKELKRQLESAAQKVLDVEKERDMFKSKQIEKGFLLGYLTNNLQEN